MFIEQLISILIGADLRLCLRRQVMRVVIGDATVMPFFVTRNDSLTNWQRVGKGGGGIQWLACSFKSTSTSRLLHRTGCTSPQLLNSDKYLLRWSAKRLVSVKHAL